MEHEFLSFPIIVASLLFILIILKWKTKNSTPNLPPGPNQLPLIGNLHQLVGSLPHRRLRDLANIYGSVMHLKLGQVTNIVISSPETAKSVMKTHDVIFAHRPNIPAFRHLTYNFQDIAFLPLGQHWTQLRKICTMELLSAKRVQSFRSIREEEVSNLINKINSAAGSPINLSRMIYSLTYGFTARASFGKKCNYSDQEAFIAIIEEIFRAGGGFNLEDVFPSFKIPQFLGGISSRLQKVCREADRILGNIINDHRERNKTAKTGGDEDEPDDFVDVLLKFQKDANLQVPLTNDHIKAVIMDVFVAGSDTASTTTDWTMSELLKHPRVMKKAQEEVRRVFDQKGKVDESGLQELTYLKSVIKETLRLRPPAPFLIPRECRETCEINGYQIPAKSKVLVNAWAIGRDPNYWTDPETFYPERFLDSSVDYKGANFEYLPFGAGRRICPGILYGIANVELPLAQFLYHFDWKLASGLEPETLDMTESFGVAIKRKNGLRLIPIPYLSPTVEGSA